MMKNSGKKETSMTAKVSAFARAWHREHSPRPVFDDPLAKVLLGEDFLQIAGQMAAGIGFFAPDFSGTEEEALTHIVNTQLGPLPPGPGGLWGAGAGAGRRMRRRTVPDPGGRL